MEQQANRVKALVVLLAIAAGASLRTEPQAVPPTASTVPARPTGFLYDDIYLKHLSGNSGHPERPERLTAIWNGLQKAGLINDIIRIAPRRATDNELALVHERSYLQLVRRELANVRGFEELSTGDTLVSADSLDAALSASGRAERRRRRHDGHSEERILCRPAARTPRRPDPRHGLLHLQQCGHRRSLRAEAGTAFIAC